MKTPNGASSAMLTAMWQIGCIRIKTCGSYANASSCSNNLLLMRYYTSRIQTRKTRPLCGSITVTIDTLKIGKFASSHDFTWCGLPMMRLTHMNVNHTVFHSAIYLDSKTRCALYGETNFAKDTMFYIIAIGYWTVDKYDNNIKNKHCNFSTVGWSLLCRSK